MTMPICTMSCTVTIIIIYMHSHCNSSHMHGMCWILRKSLEKNFSLATTSHHLCNTRSQQNPGNPRAQEREGLHFDRLKCRTWWSQAWRSLAKSMSADENLP